MLPVRIRGVRRREPGRSWRRWAIPAAFALVAAASAAVLLVYEPVQRLPVRTGASPLPPGRNLFWVVQVL